MRKKFLYLLHTDWGWIKQRSQFIAEELYALNMDLTVCYKLSPRRARLVRNATSVPIFAAAFLPFTLRTKSALRWSDIAIWRTFLRLYIKWHDVTHVIVTHPLLVDYIEGLNATIIYDCHDDNAEFYPEGALKRLIAERHATILRRSDLNVFSSRHLQEKFGQGTRSTVIRNGHSIAAGSVVGDGDGDGGREGRTFNLFYFGTISEWFDFDLIFDLLAAYDDLHITLIGPTDVLVRSHPRITYTGPMGHAELLRFAQQADGFVMPFKVNPLIEGVDPVKLYEYLSYSVPVLSVRYAELEHFRGLVDFYNSASDARDIVGRYLVNRSATIDTAARENFLASSTWRARAQCYAEALNHV
jgi:teichuronic acid biosynthesis glycosyltransferase TuaH